MSFDLTLSVERVAQSILIIRGQRVMLDADLAAIYGTTTKALNPAVKRNAKRFPIDFMFQLTKAEASSLRSQIVTLVKGRGRYAKYSPYVFTEHGALMAASVLNTERAVQTSVYVIRAFVRLREFLATHKELAAKLAELEERVTGHDDAIRALVVTIKELMAPLKQKRSERIGFRPNPSAGGPKSLRSQFATLKKRSVR